jgi:hypothetical protein
MFVGVTLPIQESRKIFSKICPEVLNLAQRKRKKKTLDKFDKIKGLMTGIRIEKICGN